MVEAAATELLPAREQPPGQQLLAIDVEARNRLLAACDAALERALERAGNRLRAKANAQRATLRNVPARLCCAHWGPTLVAAAGLDDADLLDGAWDQLETEYRRIGASAQKRALKFASRLVGMGEPDARAVYGLRQAEDLDAGWRWMKEAMGSLAKARLYTPDPGAPDVGEFDPTSRTPTGLVRQAMRVAGGVKGSANVIDLSTKGSGDVWATVPDGSAPGGIATGELITQLLRDEGGAVQGYRWVYGPADRRHPFHPHLRLDGLVFASFTDPRLAVQGSFPGTGHYIPGDHRGCICDYEPLVLTPEQVARLRADGYLPEQPELPGTAPPPPPPPEPEPEPRLGVRPMPRELRRVLGNLSDTPELRALRQTRRSSEGPLKAAESEIAHQRRLAELYRENLRKLELQDPADMGPAQLERWQKQIETERSSAELAERRAANMDRDADFYRDLLARIDADIAAKEAAPEVAEQEAKVLAQWERQQSAVMPKGLSPKAAEAWMRDTWGAKLSGQERGWYLGTLKAGAPQAEAMDRLMRQFPVTAEHVRYVGDATAVNRAGGFRTSRSGAYADANDQGQFIRLYRKWYGMEPDALAAVKKGDAALDPNGTRWSPEGTGNATSTVVHEFGHHVYFWARGGRGGDRERAAAVGKRVRAIFERHLAAEGKAFTDKNALDLVRRKISRYGATNMEEVMAESFAWVHASDTAPHPLAQELVDLITEWAEDPPDRDAW